MNENNPNLSKHLKAFEAELVSLRPNENRLNREQMIFLAGQASVSNAESGSSKLLGMNMESKAWPAAFAAMTAIAAMLLVMVVQVPQNLVNASPTPSQKTTVLEEPPQIAKDSRIPESSPAIAHNHVSNRNILTVSSARFGNLETLLAASASYRPEQSDSNETINKNHPKLTPANWNHFFQDKQPSISFPNKSSSHIHSLGVHS